ncbi:DUF2191 domain-containing protein [Georgenia yuyongxinii]
MKTTVDIPDTLAVEARALARQEGATLRELVVAGLRSEVERRRRTPPADFHFPTVDGEGLVEGVAPAAAIYRSYDVPA